MISEDLRKTLLGIVDWQLESEKTDYVKDAYEKLLAKGFCPIGAKNTIASVLSKDIYSCRKREKRIQRRKLQGRAGGNAEDLQI